MAIIQVHYADDHEWAHFVQELCPEGVRTTTMGCRPTVSEENLAVCRPNHVLVQANVWNLSILEGVSTVRKHWMTSIPTEWADCPDKTTAALRVMMTSERPFDGYSFTGEGCSLDEVGTVFSIRITNVVEHFFYVTEDGPVEVSKRIVQGWSYQEYLIS